MSDPFKDRLRTRAERDALAPATHYAQQHNLSTPPEAAYFAALPDARNDICRRLVRGILRGSPAGLCESILLSPRDLTREEPTPCAVVDTERLLEQIRPLWECCERIAFQPFPTAASVLVAPTEAIHGYDRYRFAGPISIWTPETRTELDHPVDLVSLLEREGAFVDQAQAARIKREVAESVANLALSQLGKHVLTREIDAVGEETVFDALAEGIPAADPAAGFQRLLTDGHPFHPCAKIRRGMTAAEGLVYAPEFTDRITLRFAAIEKGYTLRTRADGADYLTDQLCSMFPGLAGTLEDACGRAADEYAVVPVHPWQFNHVIPERYDDRVVALPDSIHATPLLNLRTVVPYDAETITTPQLSHLKLAIDVQTTNVVRTLSPQAVWNGPRVTDVLREIAVRESFERLGFLGETAATCYHAPDGPHPSGEPYDDARNLSALVRTNPSAHSLVPADTYPIAASCLLAEKSPGKPLVRELIAEYATATDTTGERDAAIIPDSGT